MSASCVLCSMLKVLTCLLEHAEERRKRVRRREKAEVWVGIGFACPNMRTFLAPWLSVEGYLETKDQLQMHEMNRNFFLGTPSG